MDSQEKTSGFLELGFVLLPRGDVISLETLELEFRGLDRWPSPRFDGALPDDPRPLCDLFNVARGFMNEEGFFQEQDKAIEICHSLNLHLRSLKGTKELDHIGSFVVEYEVVGCNVEKLARESLEDNSEWHSIFQPDRLTKPSTADDSVRGQVLGYDVAWLNAEFSAIRHGLLGLTRWLDVFLKELNEHGLFPNPDVARQFRQAYLSSSSQEKGTFFIHQLFLPAGAT